MPWIGVLNGDRVIPEAVADGTEVTCPDCDGQMHPRGQSTDGKARHFWHTGSLHGDGDGSTCEGGGGESDLHRRYKNHAVSRLRTLYEGEYEFAQPEYPLGEDEELPSGADQRVADALLKFSDPSDTLGHGLIVEVQYRNKGKDIDAVEQDYLQLGYSVLWTYEGDYTKDRCRITHQDIIDRVVPVWPTAIPAEPATWGESVFESLDMGAFRDLHARWRRAIRFTSDSSRDALWNLDLARVATDAEFSVPTLEARLPPDWCDMEAQLLWRTTNWDQLFTTPYDNYQYTRDGLEAADSGPGPQGSLPFIEFLLRADSWGAAHYRQQIRNAWQHGRVIHNREKHRSVKSDQESEWVSEFDEYSKPSDPDPPSNPFDDVQCRDCGKHWHYTKAYEECPACGTAVDLEWNQKTGRISQAVYEQFS